MSSLLHGGSKALLRVGGVSLVERAINGLLGVGVARVVVIVGYRGGVVATVVNRLGLTQVQTVFADEWESGNGSSLAAAEPYLDGDPTFLLVTADHLFGTGALDQLANSRAPAALIDEAPAEDVWQEGTRARLDGELVKGFSKDLESSAIDCGAFLLPRTVFDAQREMAETGDGSLAAAVNLLSSKTPFRSVPLTADSWWIDVDTPTDVRRARAALRRSLPKASDGPISRFINRPLSTRVSMAIAPLRLNPDLLSYVALVMGLTAAWALSLGRSVAGALLVFATSVFDGVDGESARLQQRDGPMGALLDGVLDRATDVAIIAGLAVWALHSGHQDVNVLVLSIAASATSILSMATKDRIVALRLTPAPEDSIAYMLGGRDGRLMLVSLAALAGEPYWGMAAILVSGIASLLARLISVGRAS
jgi:choline kinase/phosphatidylglycerophosphate synthase